MKKIFKLKNLGWIISAVLFLVLIVLIVVLVRSNKNNGDKIVDSAEILTPTEIPNLISVVRVVDGDTIVVKINDTEESVRLIGINTPEKNECFGREATEKMKDILKNEKVKLEVDMSQGDKDRYGRILRYIYLDDGTLVNKKMIEDGFGKEYTFKTAYKFKTEFKEAQNLAIKNNLGMWAVCEK
jgi:micrococcal nuclease